jgi:hypothetical protein
MLSHADIAAARAVVTLRFVQYGGLIGRFIAAGENGFWAEHVECRLPDGSTIGAHAPAGVERHPPGFDDGWTRQLLVDVPCDQDQADAFHALLRAKIGAPYDLGAILEMLEGAFAGSAPGWDEGPGVICSALIGLAAVATGIFRSAPAGRLTTPRDVLQQCAALVAVGEPQPRSASAIAGAAAAYVFHR